MKIAVTAQNLLPGYEERIMKKGDMVEALPVDTETEF